MGGQAGIAVECELNKFGEERKKLRAISFTVKPIPFLLEGREGVILGCLVMPMMSSCVAHHVLAARHGSAVQEL